jgi:hypothetical protein
MNTNSNRHKFIMFRKFCFNNSVTDTMNYLNSKEASDCWYVFTVNKRILRTNRTAEKRKSYPLCFRKHTPAPLREGKVQFGKLIYY